MKKLGKYELLEPLGEGATAEVFRARELLLQREVALKILKPALVADQASFQRFVQEARAAAGLFHPNIATVLEMDEADGRYYIAMRYVDGPSLDKILEESGPLSLENTLRMAEEIGGALDFAHGEGFLHRDVKPANILRDSKGAFWLTDFGLTKAMMSTGLTSHTGAILGTTPYVPPEIWNNQEACPATDQYALACAVYEALTGQVLFEAKTPMGVMNRHSQPRDLSAVPEALRPALQRALHQQPEERFVSMMAFASSLAAQPEPEVDPEPVPSIAQPMLPSPGLDLKLPVEGAKTAVSSASKDKTPSQQGWLLAGGLIGLALMGVAVVVGLVWMISNVTKPTAEPEPVAAVNTVAPTQVPTQVPTKVSIVTSMPTKTPVPTPALGVGSMMISDKDGMEQVYVPAGVFTMGSNDGDSDEKPVHEVYLDGYWIDKYEVTNAQYAKCVAAGECAKPSNTQYYANSQYANHPVVNVSWYNANDYCAWAGRRLPSEAEWEKAASGTDGRTYPWGNTFDGNLLNYCDQNCSYDWADNEKDDGYKQTSPVGNYPGGASPYGALDMAGNVWEWVADWYDAGYYSKSPDENPTGPSSGDRRVLRGGSWRNSERYVRSAVRDGYLPVGTSFNLGFRCASSP